jgi:hypothetical protein
MEFENQLPSFEGFFKKAHYNSDLVPAGYQSKQDFLKDFEQRFVISDAYKQIETLYNRVLKIMEDTWSDRFGDGSRQETESTANQRSEGELADSTASFRRIYGGKALGPGWKNRRKTKQK